MPLRTIRTNNAQGPGSAESLAREVRKRTSSIVGNRGNRVLVVFEKAAASIYYEGEAPSPVPRRKRRRIRGPSSA